MKNYVFDTSTNIFYDSVRGAERELGMTMAKISSSTGALMVLSHEDVCAAIAMWNNRRRDDAKGNAKKEANGTRGKKTAKKD